MKNVQELIKENGFVINKIENNTMEGIDTIYFHGEDFPNEIFEIDVPQGKVNDVELTAIRDYLEELAGDHPLY